MVKGKIVFRLAAVLIITLSTAGCLREEGEAIAQAPKPGGELQKACVVSKDIVDKSGKSTTDSTVISKKAEYPLDETDRLKEQLAIAYGGLKDAQTVKLAYDKAYNELYEEFQELRNVAIARVDSVQARIAGLSNQLGEISSRLPEFKQWNTELQVTIEDLKVRVGEIIGPSPEKLSEKFDEKLQAIPEPDCEYVPTPQDVVDKMLVLAQVKKDDLVLIKY